MEATSVRFATAVRTLGEAARRHRLTMPGFRSPPRLAGADRTLRRQAGGGSMVAVVLRGRPFQAVMSDMIEGVIVANGLTGAEATRIRTALWESMVLGLEAAA